MQARRITAGAALGAAALAAAVVHTRQTVRDTQRAHPPIGRFVTTRTGLELHYVRKGKGQPVILLHGPMTQLQDMTSSLLPALADRYAVFAFDRPGHGYSQPSPGDATELSHARALQDAAQLLRLRKPVVIGLSTGAVTALAYGLLYPQDVAGVVCLSPLVDANALSTGSQLDPAALPILGSLLSHTVYRATQPKSVARTIQQLFAPQPIPARFKRELPMEMLCRPQSIEAQAREKVHIKAALRELQDCYGEYPSRVAIFAGEEDRMIDPRRHAVTLARQLPQCELHLLPGIGHMVHHFAQAQIVDAIDRLHQSATDSSAA